jgi:hypothetical protein
MMFGIALMNHRRLYRFRFGLFRAQGKRGLPPLGARICVQDLYYRHDLVRADRFVVRIWHLVNASAYRHVRFADSPC